MASSAQLSAFLEEIERRAFKQACYATRDESTALDIVQEAMMKLAEKYGDRPAEEFPMLFQRILQNATRDHFRRQKVRSAWVTLFSSASVDGENENFDFLESLAPEDGSPQAEGPSQKVERAQILLAIDTEIENLPARQREAFLMRYWEDMSVAETALAMGCSEGSVKTHCSRATQSLAQALKSRGIRL